MSFIKIAAVLLIAVSGAYADELPTKLHCDLYRAFQAEPSYDPSEKSFNAIFRFADRIEKNPIPMVKRFIRRTNFSIDTWEGSLVNSKRSKGLISFYSMDKTGVISKETFSRKTGKEVGFKFLQLNKNGSLPLIYSERGKETLYINLNSIKDPLQAEARLLLRKSALFFSEFTRIVARYRGRLPI